MLSLLPIGDAIRLNASPGGAATIVPLADGGFAAVYRVANGPDVFTLYDDNFQPVTAEIAVTSTDFLAPQAAALNGGQFAVAWLDDSGDIEASIYNPDGTLATGPVTLATPTDPTVGVSAPRIVGNGFGGFTAIWQDNAAINGVTGTVFIQSYDNSGNLVGDPITVVPPTADPSDQSDISDFRIALLGDGTIVVAAQVQINGVDQIMYSVNGGALVSLAGGDPNYLYTNPQITPLAGGGYVITYDFVNPNLVGTDAADANWTTGGAVFASDGTQHDFAIGSTVTTTQNGTFAVDPSVITPLADGGFVVTFEPLQSPLGDGYLVDAQQFDAFGNAVGPVVLVAPQGFLPSVATSANGVVLDTYQFGAGVFLQPYTSAPTPQGPEPVGTSFGLNSVTSANSPGVAPLTTGGFVVVYQDENGNSWARIFGYDRQPVADAWEIAAGGTQPVVASQTNGTFLVAWSIGTEIMGALYDNQGDLLGGPFDMSGAPSTLPLLDPALNSLPDGGYTLAYETDLQDGTGSHLVTIQEFDGEGNAVGTAVSQSFAPTNPLSPPKIAALEAQLFGSVTVIGVGDAVVAAIVSDPPSGNGNAGVAGQGIEVTSHAGIQPPTTTIQVSGANDGATRDGAQVATINDGNIVVVWNEADANSAIWRVMGQVMTPAGVFVGGQFSITTSLPSNSPSSQIALSALPDGGFLVTYNAGNSSLASQRFDSSGDAMGLPVLVTGTGEADVVTTVLSNGTLLLASDNTPMGGGSVTAETFSLSAVPMNWNGSTGTDLGTAANWDIDAAPDGGHVMQFGSVAPSGTLTGTVTAEAASFTGQGPWVLSGVKVNLVQGMTEQSPLQVTGGTLAAGGTAALEGPVTVSGGAQVSFQSTGIGTSAGQTGTLSLSGVGTSWTDTGTGGSRGFQAGGSAGAQPGDGAITVAQGALLSGSDTDVLGVSAGSEGDLSIVTGGTVTDAGLVVGQSGMADGTVNGGLLNDTGSVTIGQNAGGQGVLTVSGTSAAVTASGAVIVGGSGIGSLAIQNQGTFVSGGTSASASPGIDIGQLTGGSGAITVSGTQSLLTNTGTFVVGDAGLGNLTVNDGGGVTTSAEAIIANTASASNSSVGVTGAGSQFNVVGALVVGEAGFGQLSIAQSASVTAGSVDMGAAAGGDGAIYLSGAGSALTVTGALTVGDQSSGSLNIENGASVSAGSLTIGSGATGSGDVVIGPGSHLTLTGTVINVGLAGSGVLDIQGGTLSLVNGTTLDPGTFGRIVQVGGLIDPAATLGVSGNSYGSNSTDEANVEVLNKGVATIQGGDATFLAPLVTSGNTVTTAGVWNIVSGGTLILDVNTVDNSQTISFGDATGGLVIGQQITLDATETPRTIAASALSGFQAPIEGFQAGDQIAFSGLTVASDQVVGNVVTLFDAQHDTLGTLTFQTGKGGADDAGAAAAAAQIVPCFVAGTRIATARGLVPVESIQPSDRVCTILGGDTAEVVWVGHRKVECARHLNPSKVWPVRVTADAFGRGMPATDLLLSPDHAVYVDRVLIPIRLLVNGQTVRQELTDRVCYHHIELAQHDVLLANGMPAESYLDTGDRMRFSNGGSVIMLHPDFSARHWEIHGCAPLVQTGPKLAAVRKRLAADVARRKQAAREFLSPGTRWPAGPRGIGPRGVGRD